MDRRHESEAAIGRNYGISCSTSSPALECHAFSRTASAASTESDEINYPSHGDVERLAESSLYPFAQFVWNVVIEVAAKT
jgi:hypothetical protein